MTHSIKDSKGETIAIGSLVSMGDDEAGVVRNILDSDEGSMPRVVVEWEDGLEEEFPAYDARSWYTEAEDLRCDDLTVVPS
jgi:hypothetical protein